MVARLTLLAFALLVLAAPAQANKAGRKHSSAKLAECDRDGHSATFEGSMEAYRRATVLEMRFVLQTRDAANPKWARVDADGFGEWLQADPDTRDYVYDKRVEDLAVGADYRVKIRFRFRKVDSGKVVGRGRKRTRACRQPDDRPDLSVLGVTVSAGKSETQRRYAVQVFNDGNSPAPLFATSLTIGDGPVLRSTTEELAAVGETVVEFQGPPCEEGDDLTATVDVDGDVDETDEANNTLTIPCPPPAARGQRATRPLTSRA